MNRREFLIRSLAVTVPLAIRVRMVAETAADPPRPKMYDFDCEPPLTLTIDGVPVKPTREWSESEQRYIDVYRVPSGCAIANRPIFIA